MTADGRYDVFCRSFDCYVSQTYPNTELVIVNEGSKEYQRKIADKAQGRTDVKLIFLDGEYTLGALRNISISLCEGDLFVQWDDDDFNMPERLSVQYAYLSKHKKARVCYLTDQLHYYFNLNQLYWENWQKFLSAQIKEFSLIPGTIMAYKEGFDFAYPSAGKFAAAGEDSILAHDLCKQDDRVVLLEGIGYLHVYSFHGNNVWGLDHHQNISTGRSESASHMRKHRDQISRTLNHLNFAPEIKVMGRDGLGFIHGGISFA